MSNETLPDNGKSEELIGLYPFLGNDYTPVFYTKGNVRPINLALKDTNSVKVFS